MKKRIDFINVIGLLMGLIVSIGIFTGWFGVLFSNIILLLTIGVVGSIVSIWALKKSDGYFYKIIAVVGFLLNILPIGYFILLYFSFG